MSKNVLAIGCSHLSGAYGMEDQIVGPESYAYWLWKDYYPDQKFTTFPNPGHGILTFAGIVEHLHRNNLLQKYTHCLLQLTSEPRIHFPNAGVEEKFYEQVTYLATRNESFVDGHGISVKYFDTVLSNNQRNLYEQHANKFGDSYRSISGKLIWSEISEEIALSLTETKIATQMFRICYTYIIKTLTDNNVKPVVIDWWGRPMIKFDGIERVNNELPGYIFPFNMGLKQISEKRGIWDRTKYTPMGHHNAEQNRVFASIINEFIENGRHFD